MALDFTCVSTPETVSVKINVARSNMKVAPEGMIFTVDLEGFDAQAPDNPTAYNPQLHEIYYFWTFGDTGSTFTAPLKVLAHQQDANTMTGPVAAHTYAQAGEYTISVLVMEPASGKTVTATLTLEGDDAVQDPDLVFQGANTYWMDVNDDGAGSPAGSLVYDDIQSALNHAWGHNKPCRLLFREAQVWNLPAMLDVRGERAYVNILMQGEGETPAELIPPPETGLFRARNWGENTLDVVLSNLKFSGPWDETTERNPGAVKTGFSFLSSGDTHPVSYVWAHKCTFSGFYSSITMTATDHPSKAFGISDCGIESWLNIGAFLNTKCPTAVIGTRMARDPSALGGGTKADHNVHGPIRSQYAGPLVIAKNDMFSNSGWFPNAFGYHTQQPTLRLFQSGIAGGVANLSHNTLEGGYPVIALSRQDPAFGLGTQNAIVDGNMMIGGHMTPFAILSEYGGVSVRNNVYIKPDTPAIKAIYDPVSFFSATLPSGEKIGPATAQELTDNAAAPVKVYNNTYAMLTSAANFFGSEQGADVLKATGFSHVEEANNVTHAPNATAPITADGPLDDTVLFAPRMLGYRTAYELVRHTLGADVLNGGSFTLPYPSGRVAADYGPSTSLDGHRIGTSAGKFDSTAGEMAVTFEASEIVVTNTSGRPWASGDIEIVFYALNTPPPRQDQYATPENSIAFYKPLEGSSALGAAIHDPVAITDFYGNIRPVYPSLGAFEHVG